MFLYPRLGRAIVLVKEDQLSLAIGRRGQNVRLACKLVGWDIEIMTIDELNEGIERAEGWFTQIPNVTTEMVERFIEEGFLSYDDLTFVEPAELGELIGVSEEDADDIIMFAEEAGRARREGKSGRRRKRRPGLGAPATHTGERGRRAVRREPCPAHGIEADARFAVWSGGSGRSARGGGGRRSGAQATSRNRPLRSRSPPSPLLSRRVPPKSPLKTTANREGERP